MADPQQIKPSKAMTVRELILELSKLDPELPVHGHSFVDENEITSVEIREADKYGFYPRHVYLY